MVFRRLAILLVLLLAGCPTFTSLKHLSDMSTAELARYSTRVSYQVEAVTLVALTRGDLTPEEAVKIASDLDRIAAGSVAPGAGALGLDLDGYGALALSIIISEIDAQLDARGAFDTGQWIRAAPVLRGMSEGILRAVAE